MSYSSLVQLGTANSKQRQRTQNIAGMDFPTSEGVVHFIMRAKLEGVTAQNKLRSVQEQIRKLIVKPLADIFFLTYELGEEHSLKSHSAMGSIPLTTNSSGRHGKSIFIMFMDSELGPEHAEELTRLNSFTRVAFEITIVLGDRDLLLILAFFIIVMYGESRGN